ELGAVPLNDASPVITHVILAGCTHRAQNVCKTQFFKTFLREVEVLKAPAHLFRRHVLTLAELLLGGTDGLYLQHGNDHAACMGDGAHGGAVGAGTLTLVVHVFFEIFVNTAFVSAVMNRDALVALGSGAQVLYVGLGGRPPDTVDFLARATDCLCLANGGGSHDARAPKQDVIRPRLADLQPGGFLLNAGRGNRIQLQFEPISLGTRLQQGNWLLPIRRIVIDKRDLLALELVFAAQLLGDVLNHDVGSRPVVAKQGEVPLEHGAIGRLRQAVAHGFDGYAVNNGAVGQGEGNAR